MKINEVFYSIQGEGPSIGQPVVFVRLSGCNQNCNFCDTKYHTKIDDSLTPQTILKTLKENPNCNRIIFTGGEPLLQQEEICRFLLDNYQSLKTTYIEFETNGTIMIKKNLVEILYHKFFNVHFNVSPKLASSGNKKIRFFYKQFKKLISPYTSIFKFVYVPGQVLEILDFIEKNNIPKEKVFLMPEGATKKEQESLMQEVVDFCKKFGFTFSPRLHVLIWDKERGV